MTPNQYYFPYFFQLDTFNRELKPFGLSSYITYDSKALLPANLLITKEGTKEVLVSVPFGTILMVQGDKLVYWQTSNNQIDITQVSLFNLAEEPEIVNTKVDLERLHTGKNTVRTYLDIEYLVTYTRKDSITYDQGYYEKFVILLIKKEQITIMPFDWFNKTAGDYGYVWPATARLDLEKGILYGKGMRMSDFCVKLDKSCL